MTNRASLIAAAGYSGPSNERTWRERIKKLDELGFIRIASGKHGDISCVLILNPHKVLRKHKEQKTPGFDDRIYNCILEELANYGMTDFDEESEEQEQPPPSQLAPIPAPPPTSAPEPPPERKHLLSRVTKG
jgi:hypothetical protein